MKFTGACLQHGDDGWGGGDVSPRWSAFFQSMKHAPCPQPLLPAGCLFARCGSCTPDVCPLTGNTAVLSVKFRSSAHLSVNGTFRHACRLALPSACDGTCATFRNAAVFMRNCVAPDVAVVDKAWCFQPSLAELRTLALLIPGLCARLPSPSVT